MKQHFEMFAAYNKWANARLSDAAALLSKEELERDTGAFFKSMLRIELTTFAICSANAVSTSGTRTRTISFSRSMSG